MILDDQLKLSYYKKIADIDKSHNVQLVQNTESSKIFILKTLHIYNIRVFQYLASHPISGTPKIIELIEGDDVLYVIEEYLSGTTLREMLDERGALSENEGVRYILQLCHIVKQFHNSTPPIIHRDIKPDNIIITPDCRLFLVDFNAAKETKPQQTQDTVLMGTTGYAAPEQYGFSSSTPSVDIYAIGVLLNEILTGSLPNKVHCTGRLSAVVDKCTQMDSKNRYEDMNHLISAISKPAALKALSVPQFISDWLPPGFRGKNVRVMIFASLWYLFCIWMCSCLTVENTYGTELFFYRIIIYALFLLETLWLGNYRNIWNRLPLSNCHNLFLKITGIALWCIALAFLMIFILAIVIAIFVG